MHPEQAIGVPKVARVHAAARSIGYSLLGRRPGHFRLGVRQLLGRLLFLLRDDHGHDRTDGTRTWALVKPPLKSSSATVTSCILLQADGLPTGSRSGRGLSGNYTSINTL